MAQATWEELANGTHVKHSTSKHGCQRVLGRSDRRYLVHHMEDALSAVLTKRLTARQAAKQFNVPRSTITAHLNPSSPLFERVPGEEHRDLLLAPAEEEVFAAIMYASGTIPSGSVFR